MTDRKSTKDVEQSENTGFPKFMASFWEMTTQPEHQAQLAYPVIRHSPDELEQFVLDEYEGEYIEFLSRSDRFPSEQLGLIPTYCETERIAVPLHFTSHIDGRIGNVIPEFSPTWSFRPERDQQLVKRLKQLHSFRCQVCGLRIPNPKSEDGWSCHAHHLKPLGSPHFGPDIPSNIVIVCPNHHTAFENGVIFLVTTNLKIARGHRIAQEFTNYHNENLFTLCEPFDCAI